LLQFGATLPGKKAVAQAFMDLFKVEYHQTPKWFKLGSASYSEARPSTFVFRQSADEFGSTLDCVSLLGLVSCFSVVAGACVLAI